MATTSTPQILCKITTQLMVMSWSLPAGQSSPAKSPVARPTSGQHSGAPHLKTQNHINFKTCKQFAVFTLKNMIYLQKKWDFFSYFYLSEPALKFDPFAQWQHLQTITCSSGCSVEIITQRCGAVSHTHTSQLYWLTFHKRSVLVLTTTLWVTIARVLFNHTADKGSQQPNLIPPRL